MANKKLKTSKGKGGKSGGKKSVSGSQKEENGREATPQIPPQDRVNAVKQLWETLSEEERVKLLTIDLPNLRKQARELNEKLLSHSGDLPDYPSPPPLDEVLEEGVQRLREKGTWKVWRWPPEQLEFTDGESFKQYIRTQQVREHLKHLLPKDEPKATEKASEGAFRQRMTDLLQKIQNSTRQLQDDTQQRWYRGGRAHRTGSGDLHQSVRDINIYLVQTILEAMQEEHETLYSSLVAPITGYLAECIPEEMMESNKSEIVFEDLEKLPVEEVARICEWLTEKVDALTARLKPEAKEEEEEEENMGDVDLFSLTEEDQLTVNCKWLQHLQERLLGEDGHPRKVLEGEDPHKMGLVLEWVYGSIVSTAEKARDGAKRQLGSAPPSAMASHDVFVTALEDQLHWENRVKTAKELLAEMLKSRKDFGEIMKECASRPGPTPPKPSVNFDDIPLPDEVVVSMLKREALLTRAKLHYLAFERYTEERKLKQIKMQIRQGEPEFERLKRELEEVKHAPRGMDGAFRTAAEMERHRHQMADAAIEEQLEVQTAFREHGSRLQTIYDKRQRTEFELNKKENEIKQLNQWRSTVENLATRFETLLAQSGANETMEGPGGSIGNPEDGPGSMTSLPPPEISGVDGGDSGGSSSLLSPLGSGALQVTTLHSRSTSPQQVTLNKLRAHFHKDVRKQLYTLDDDKQFFNKINNELKAVDKLLEEGRVALQHLEVHLINVACDDPGAAIGAQLALPILQDRLDQMALEYAAQKAKEAEVEIMKMEMEAKSRAEAEKKKKLLQKQKKADKNKSEKEKVLAEKSAKEEADKARRLEEERLRKEQEEEERVRRQERLEVVRKQEEEAMRQRREELLSDKTSHWSLRKEQDEQLQRAALSIPVNTDDGEEEESDTSGSSEGTWGGRPVLHSSECNGDLINHESGKAARAQARMIGWDAKPERGPNLGNGRPRLHRNADGDHTSRRFPRDRESSARGTSGPPGQRSATDGGQLSDTLAQKLRAMQEMQKNALKVQEESVVNEGSQCDGHVAALQSTETETPGSAKIATGRQQVEQIAVTDLQHVVSCGQDNGSISGPGTPDLVGRRTPVEEEEPSLTAGGSYTSKLHNEVLIEVDATSSAPVVVCAVEVLDTKASIAVEDKDELAKESMDTSQQAYEQEAPVVTETEGMPEVVASPPIVSKLTFGSLLGVGVESRELAESGDHLAQEASEGLIETDGDGPQPREERGGEDGPVSQAPSQLEIAHAGVAVPVELHQGPSEHGTPNISQAQGSVHGAVPRPLHAVPHLAGVPSANQTSIPVPLPGPPHVLPGAVSGSPHPVLPHYVGNPARPVHSPTHPHPHQYLSPEVALRHAQLPPSPHQYGPQHPLPGPQRPVNGPVMMMPHLLPAMHLGPPHALVPGYSIGMPSAPALSGPINPAVMHQPVRPPHDRASVAAPPTLPGGPPHHPMGQQHRINQVPGTVSGPQRIAANNGTPNNKARSPQAAPAPVQASMNHRPLPHIPPHQVPLNSSGVPVAIGPQGVPHRMPPPHSGGAYPGSVSSMATPAMGQTHPAQHAYMLHPGLAAGARPAPAAGLPSAQIAVLACQASPASVAGSTPPAAQPPPPPKSATQVSSTSQLQNSQPKTSTLRAAAMPFVPANLRSSQPASPTTSTTSSQEANHTSLKRPATNDGYRGPKQQHTSHVMHKGVEEYLGGVDYHHGPWPYWEGPHQGFQAPGRPEWAQEQKMWPPELSRTSPSDGYLTGGRGPPDLYNPRSVSQQGPRRTRSQHRREEFNRPSQASDHAAEATPSKGEDSATSSSQAVEKVSSDIPAVEDDGPGLARGSVPAGVAEVGVAEGDQPSAAPNDEVPVSSVDEVCTPALMPLDRPSSTPQAQPEVAGTDSDVLARCAPDGDSNMETSASTNPMGDIPSEVSSVETSTTLMAGGLRAGCSKPVQEDLDTSEEEMLLTATSQPTPGGPPVPQTAVPPASVPSGSLKSSWSVIAASKVAPAQNTLPPPTGPVSPVVQQQQSLPNLTASSSAFPSISGTSSSSRGPSSAVVAGPQGSWKGGSGTLRQKLQQGPLPKKQEGKGTVSLPAGEQPWGISSTNTSTSTPEASEVTAIVAPGPSGQPAGQSQKRLKVPIQEKPQGSQPSTSGRDEAAALALLRGLKLVRGLKNDDGQYNCFLNVVIQCLWHIHEFRHTILNLRKEQMDPPPQAKVQSADLQVLTALWDIFHALEKAPQQTLSTETIWKVAKNYQGPGFPTASSTSGKSNAASSGVSSGNGSIASENTSMTTGCYVVSPAQLRQALSSSGPGGMQIQLSEMHDASEVFGEVLSCLHRAELGCKGIVLDHDPQLPQRYKIRVDTGMVVSSGGHKENTVCNGNPGGLTRGGIPTPKTLVHRLFGLDMQEPCLPDSEEDEEKGKGRKGRRKAQEQGGKDPVKEGAKKPAREPGVSEVQRYMKYFHLVPAQGLRAAAYDSFEKRLVAAIGGDVQALVKDTPAHQGTTLLRTPSIFTVAVVWESPQAPVEAIRSTLDAVAVQVDLSLMFSGLPKGPVHHLRSVLCYFGHHYQVFVRSEEVEEWILLDDEFIKWIGSWQDVCTTICMNRLQPSLLFYEA